MSLATMTKASKAVREYFCNACKYKWGSITASYKCPKCGSKDVVKR